MDFRTPIKIEKSGFTLSPLRSVVLLGSCFADNIAAKMQATLWEGINPCGALYNPFSIAKALEMAAFSRYPLQDFDSTLFQDGEFIHSWLFDSKMSGRRVDECHRKFNAMRESLLSCLERAEVLFITFGTSYCYYLPERGDDYVVANCHKCASSRFIRHRASVKQIIQVWTSLVNKIKLRFPALRIIFTVSPVRHLKDGLVENSRSKAVLQLAVEELCSDFGCCSYFPAYEIMNDDLRDYRFYASDLAHPSGQGVEYIWEIFRHTYLDADGESILKEGEKIVKLRNHRPLLESPEATASRLAHAELLHKNYLTKYYGKDK